MALLTIRSAEAQKSAQVQIVAEQTGRAIELLQPLYPGVNFRQANISCAPKRYFDFVVTMSGQDPNFVQVLGTYNTKTKKIDINCNRTGQSRKALETQILGTLVHELTHWADYKIGYKFACPGQKEGRAYGNMLDLVGPRSINVKVRLAWPNWKKNLHYMRTCKGSRNGNAWTAKSPWY